MFIYFNENKLAYHKGQLAPFFIVIIVILIIASLITINIGKIAGTKTFSGNAADAGALAAASTMASAFNYIAVANSTMEMNYWNFFASISISFAIAYTQMGVAIATTAAAMALGCFVPCSAPPIIASAIASLESFVLTTTGLIATVLGFWMTQQNFYEIIRENADSYHRAAFNAGYGFAFSNSGIGSKLTQEELLAFRIWRNALMLIDDNIMPLPNGFIQSFDWDDGQGRNHNIAVQVWLDPIKDYRLQKTVMGFYEIEGILTGNIVAAQLAVTALTTASVEMGVACAASIVFYIAQACALAMFAACEGGCVYCCPVAAACEAVAIAAFATWMAACAAAEIAMATAIAEEIAALAATATAHTGLAVNGTFNSSSASDPEDKIICWIDDVDHNGLVSVIQTQRHQGGDLGMWSTEYPMITASTKASFRIPGKGSIYSPSPEFNSSIVSTDFYPLDLLLPLNEPIKQDIDWGRD